VVVLVEIVACSSQPILVQVLLFRKKDGPCAVGITGVPEMQHTPGRMAGIPMLMVAMVDIAKSQCWRCRRAHAARSEVRMRRSKLWQAAFSLE
jgi:hypothetical protein